MSQTQRTQEPPTPKTRRAHRAQKHFGATGRRPDHRSHLQCPVGGSGTAGVPRPTRAATLGRPRSSPAPIYIPGRRGCRADLPIYTRVSIYPPGRRGCRADLPAYTLGRRGCRADLPSYPRVGVAAEPNGLSLHPVGVAAEPTCPRMTGTHHRLGGDARAWLRSRSPRASLPIRGGSARTHSARR